MQNKARLEEGVEERVRADIFDKGEDAGTIDWAAPLLVCRPMQNLERLDPAESLK
jgi:hypothetical protein